MRARERGSEGRERVDVGRPRERRMKVVDSVLVEICIVENGAQKEQE